jgi:hypothetical protein
LDIKASAARMSLRPTSRSCPTQFIIIRRFFAEIRKHGNSGKHLSGGERSMLSGFQEAAQKVPEQDE